MALTFDVLRNRSNAAIEANEARLQIPSRRSYARHRLQTLLDRRAEIEDLASTQDQREAYGIEQWHAEFVRLDGREDAEEIWSQLPTCRFKRFQELFCRSRIVPSCMDCMKRQDFDALPLSACLVSADRIPDEFAESVCLVAFDESDKPYDRLKKKHDAIPQLKKLWESTVQFDPEKDRKSVV